MISQQTVVMAIPIINCCALPGAVPCLVMYRKTAETRNELTMATISHHAVTRHQNQRTR